MSDDSRPSLAKGSISLEKHTGGSDAYEVTKDGQSPACTPRDESDVYQFFVSYQESHAGRLVLDPGFAPAEFGEDIAKQLKLSPDKSKILWPQPADDSHDPQNWSKARKTLQLTIATLAAVVPDFDSSIGIAAVFAMARDFHTTPNHVNQLGQSWAIFAIGWGGIFAVMLIRRYGRLPVLFWSQLLALGFMIGVTFAPNLTVSAAMRTLVGFFGTCAQVSGLYVVTDMYPVHLQARKLSIWTMGFVISPVLAPFLLGFLVARANWRWAYGIGTIYNAIVMLLIAFFSEETMYDRHLEKPHPYTTPGTARYRIETLLGLTGYRMARFRPSWKAVALAPLRVFWRPHLLAALWFEGAMFGFQIGFHVTNSVVLANPPPNGYGYGQIQIAATYASSLGAVLIGEVVGRYLNDWLLEVTVRRNKGVFEAECRLWACYPSVALFVCGSVLQGAAFQLHLHIAVLVVGWVLAQMAVMMNTSAIYAYCNDCFPKYQGEISALINLARSLGGFGVAYFQVNWVTRHGALQAFGTEAGIVAGLFLLMVPVLQIKGSYLQSRFAVN
ncbi:MFS general substrate transporter [Dichomitus squalens LYAD-421 SS1]|uniref:MFS general substrate transporter n=1 Tax=Dichomitus squalens (strain LYAD-421) TaxID=732165 RepID=R7SVD5_DICSQ|nr:MFS general substrate transporter [Dichomitus squalens LYAD-421 SS1]EJF58947.1 MFS general substrate transporter [Dichomitus squalens LYAD-421 SS1]